ncbi:Lipopolysaccharide core heptosyltransferase rfaQ [Serratia entomophila]|uniref:glycosyltransferase family 9 protein n=1 Tax=Serratia entomophila TaxID=42906 RepID=UPI001F303CD1|nr:glycosyltransferase family 9 protein [Serratia entomophila]UIW18327.1 glycosyltransferase family 9 protein [Serratia entomophila]CAI0795856.1 Lipopolysaccharide core heptosyltransferase rfaQ [Serratia entomophila]CAI1084097.1 Lipopolysaccharide core heptosyltransferase rfaQ [Serratia entomophila]CAI1087075.1 Lipopolysaccharide core heptosyltransferase rfaQ [Serratia entomophila]CAI1112184.1 Lipopolysaccharide core heptosyltransferase rfaQ [Serratia entomophila]
MSKQWKVKLANACLRLYTKFGSNFKDKGSFDKSREFERIAIFSTTALGDLMFNTPAIRAIRERYPNAKITLISSYKNGGLVGTCSYFNNVIYWDHKAKDMLGVILQLRKNRPQLAVILHSKAPYDILTAIFSGCEYVFKDAYKNDLGGMEQWLTGISIRDRGHLIQRKLDLVGLLGCDAQNREMFIPVDFPLQQKQPGSIVVGFQMGASEVLRCWPVGNFIGLAKMLLTLSPDYQIALIGTPKERTIEHEFMAGLTADEQRRVVSYIGKTTLPQLLGVIKNMDALVTGDTGPLHLAIALKTKTVSLFVTADPQQTGPYQNPELHQVMHVPVEAQQLSEAQRRQPLSIITSHEVMARVTQLLGEQPSS